MTKTTESKCSFCNGSGVVHGEQCVACAGKGYAGDLAATETTIAMQAATTCARAGCGHGKMSHYAGVDDCMMDSAFGGQCLCTRFVTACVWPPSADVDVGDILSLHGLPSPELSVAWNDRIVHAVREAFEVGGRLAQAAENRNKVK